MSEQLDELNEKLDKILSNLSKKDSSIKKLDILEKLLIPVLLGFLAFITNRAGNQISAAQLELSKAQLKLAEAQNVRQESEAKNNLQTKYIELFYKEISSQDAKKQEYALSFLKLISPDAATPLLSWAAIYVKPEVKPQINAAKNEINFRILSSYEIILYFLENNQDLLKSAQDIKQSLVKYGLRENQIKLDQKDDAFFQKLGYPTGYEIRYDRGSEDNAAQLLENILKSAYPSKQFVKRGIGSSTKNSISIFFIQ